MSGSRPPERPYHHGDLRRALIDAGVELAVAGGPDAVQLREASRRVGVSHSAGYRHFDSREAFLSAVGAQGMSRLAGAMREALAGVSRPGRTRAALARARLRAIGRAYVRFAVAQPGLFQVAFQDPGEPAAGGPAAADVDDPYRILGSVIDELVEAGVLPPRRRQHSDLAAWSAVHGFASLLLDGPLRKLPGAQVDAALERLLETVESGL